MCLGPRGRKATLKLNVSMFVSVDLRAHSTPPSSFEATLTEAVFYDDVPNETLPPTKLIPTRTIIVLLARSHASHSYPQASGEILQDFTRFCKHIKDSKERLFIVTQTYNMHIFGETPFVKLQNDT